ncbi:MAG: plastocyanin/azurin family copper-binding protein [Armatimonadota bacterium]|nr:plastocyanin/azurin family copper-binding protein [Armatimonadota bacterium]MDR7533772.1 plastocyanin/azurin family copper-binding protein [Armatimonadota bacterium]MDR7535762.1 plastocyanin/azurin family copper-binding protein [Armatimonadota bacterium]
MRLRTAMLLGVLVVLSVVLVPQAQGAPRPWTVLVGGGVAGTAVVSNAFQPRSVEVAVGDTVTWQFQQPWPLHTVTFTSGQPVPPLTVQEGSKTYFNPDVFFPKGDKTHDGSGYRNSGIPPAPEDPKTRFSYSLTFTRAGTYDYVCALHPGQAGRIVVRDRAAGSPAQAAARGRSELAAVLKAGRAAFAGWRPQRQDTTVMLPMLGNVKERWSHFRFSREPVVVARGTTVTWVVRDPLEIHTVTFTSGGKVPEFIVVESQAQGPPKLLLNPKVGAPAGTQTYDGKGYANSGILFPEGNPMKLPSSYSLTFTRAGRYEYYCVIHAPWGMKGTIVVQ